MAAPAYVDSERAVHDWINTLTSLVGPGMPIPLGCHYRRLRAPAQGTYLVLEQVAGTDDPSEYPGSLPVLSGHVYAGTKETAAKGAVAYANALRRLDGRPQPMTGALCVVVDQIQGPRWLPDGDEPRFVVDARFSLTPA